MVIKQGIPKSKRLEVAKWAYGNFNEVIEEELFLTIIAEETNWSLSAMLVDSEDKIQGLYLLGDLQVDSIIDTDIYKNLKGVEGILLAVDSSIRGQGWGNKLKNYPSILGFDYIWGQQFKTLNNLKDWLKRRVLVGQTKSVYVTLEKYSK